MTLSTSSSSTMSVLSATLTNTINAATDHIFTAATDDKDDIERAIKEEMLEGMSVIKVNKMVMDISKLRFTGEKIEDKEESMRRQIECGYCKQKEGKVMTSTDVFQSFSKLKQKYVEEI